MLKQLSIRNFKCFPEQEISFYPMTVLAGGNGVGKSSVIQSLLLMRRAAEILSVNKDEVELNGPYLLQLGNASMVRSSLPGSDVIEMSLCYDEDKKSSFTFDIDEKLTPLALHINSSLVDFDLAGCPLHYLHAERIGPRKALDMHVTKDLYVGHRGEYTNHALYQADITERLVCGDLIKELKLKRRFSAQVEAWLQTVIPGIQLQVVSYGEVSMVSVKYQNIKDAGYYLPTSTGFGITYVLPVIVAGLLASTEDKAVFIVENPEAHLHPRGQSRIGRFLACLSAAGVQVIVETHSDHVIDGARLQLAEMNQTEKLLVNFFYEGHNHILVKPITANKLGELSAWPLGFFDQKQLDLRDLLRLKIK